MTHKSERITIPSPEAAKEYEGREVRLFWRGESRGCGVLRVKGDKIGVGTRLGYVGEPSIDAVIFSCGTMAGNQCTIELVQETSVWYLTPERHDLSREFHDAGAMAIVVGDKVRLTHEDGSVTDHTANSYNTFAGFGVDPPVRGRLTWVSHRMGIVRVERLPPDPAPDAQEPEDALGARLRGMVGSTVRVIAAPGNSVPRGCEGRVGVLRTVTVNASSCRVDVEGCATYFIGPSYWPDLELVTAEDRLARIREEHSEAHRAFDAARAHLQEMNQTEREIAAEIETERKAAEDARFPLPEGWEWNGTCARGTDTNVFIEDDALEFSVDEDSAPLAVVRAVIARHDAEKERG